MAPWNWGLEHWLSLAVTGCHWLSLAVTGCHWLLWPKIAVAWSQGCAAARLRGCAVPLRWAQGGVVAQPCWRCWIKSQAMTSWAKTSHLVTTEMMMNDDDWWWTMMNYTLMNYDEWWWLIHHESRVVGMAGKRYLSFKILLSGNRSQSIGFFLIFPSQTTGVASWSQGTCGVPCSISSSSAKPW